MEKIAAAALFAGFWRFRHLADQNIIKNESKLHNKGGLLTGSLLRPANLGRGDQRKDEELIRILWR